jgi:hypothetical protein
MTQNMALITLNGFYFKKIVEMPKKTLFFCNIVGLVAALPLKQLGLYLKQMYIKNNKLCNVAKNLSTVRYTVRFSLP